MKLELASSTVNGLEVVANPCDLHHDLHIYINYVREREIKRMHRTNQLSKADFSRLARLMTDPLAQDQINTEGSSSWIRFIDRLALLLELVQYDTKGVYTGYSSQAESFPDNYIIFNEAKYQEFLKAAPIEHENRILMALTNQLGNEFYHGSLFGRLNGFDSYGSATGVMPQLQFARIRLILLGVLKQLESGIWYSTADLIRYLKQSQRYFIIPQHPGKDRWKKSVTRYGNFYETKNRYLHQEKPIADDAPDGFERVEGRYVERFLENIPLLLQYVELGYDPASYKGLFPEMGVLKAFRLTERFQRLQQDQAARPKVTVQPNFEIIVESDIYPAGILAQLGPLTERVSGAGGGAAAAATILTLKKERVAAALAQDSSLDVAAVLRQLTNQALPQNVLVELEEWSGHADQFVLFSGFGLLESADPAPAADGLTVEQVAPQLRIVCRPDELARQLEQAEQAPLWVEHGWERLARLPEKAQTVFPKRSPEAAAEPAASHPEAVRINRMAYTQLEFPANGLFERVRLALVENRCPIEANLTERTITYSQAYEPLVERIFDSYRAEYRIEIQDKIG